MKYKAFIDKNRNSVMSSGEFRDFIRAVYVMAGKNYTLAAKWLGNSPPNVRYVILGGDSDSLRRSVNIKKSDRLRECFECTPETKHNVRLLLEETGLTKSELLEEMIDTYFEKLEPYEP